MTEGEKTDFEKKQGGEIIRVGNRNEVIKGNE